MKLQGRKFAGVDMSGRWQRVGIRETVLHRVLGVDGEAVEARRHWVGRESAEKWERLGNEAVVFGSDPVPGMFWGFFFGQEVSWRCNGDGAWRLEICASYAGGVVSRIFLKKCRGER